LKEEMSSKTNNFIVKAVEKHGIDKYDYSLVNYKNSKTKVIITCKIHGNFDQEPTKHLQGQGCSKCRDVVFSKSQNIFIEEALKKHGNKYDYSLISYVNNRTKIIIICKIHGNFDQNPNKHLQGQGCPKCAKISRKLSQTKTKEQFIEDAVKKHGDKYEYSSIIYVNDGTKVIITCKIHGNFQQVPSDHLRGNGCSECALISSGLIRTKPQEDFIENCVKKHGDKYDYSLVNYKNSVTKITITCKIHGNFEQKAQNHLRGDGCPKCGYLLLAGRNSKTGKEFIEDSVKIHGKDKYDYSLVDYKNSKTKIIIICKIHGNFEQTPSNHLQGCPMCVQINRKLSPPKDQFIEDAIKLYGKDKYDYSLINYKNSKTKIIIICKTHGNFEQTPANHLKGKGCYNCNFIENAIRQHGDKYDYSSVNYKNYKTKIIIICKIHGIFEQPPSSHLQRSGCPKCGISQIKSKMSKTREKFIEDAVKKHENEYDYSLVKYVNSHESVIITCKTHGNFEQTPANHLNGNGCPKCGKIYSALIQTKTKEEFIENCVKKHGDRYDYSLVNYKNSATRVMIICKIHGNFEQTPQNHLKNGGCLKCGQTFNALIQTRTKDDFIKNAVNVHGDKYDYSLISYQNSKIKVIILCKTHGKFEQTPKSHLQGTGCPKCLLCPSCLLWRTRGVLCEYCKPANKNKLYQKTKEMAVVNFLKSKLPDTDFIHNKSVGNDCTGGHLFPDIRFDFLWFQLIVEVDEHKHRGASYQCEEKRMYDITAKLGQPCIFIRYNPDHKNSEKDTLLKRIEYYIDLQDYYDQDSNGDKIECYKKINIDNPILGFTKEYMFYD
jgi:succinylglutamate desuccinylase